MRMRFRSGLMFIVLATLSLTSLAAELVKSERDPRSYRYLELDNSLRVLLVSDPKLEKAAAALSIDVGSNANPRGREGLAHFLEHMLFLGTEKYPQADSYQQFISANGGSHNAFTAYENTTYFFDVAAPALAPALDRFAQFFIAPLFNPDYVDRERHAVASEYESKRLDDGRRNYVADKQLMDPRHAWSYFAVGNLDTLGNQSGQLRDDLIQFFERYYSANLMSLALISPASLDSLEQLVRDQFSAIPNRNREVYQDPVPPYNTDELPLQLDVKTLKTMQQLRISFILPPTRDLWRTKPLHYIANQLGYEGRGSLLSYLKRQGWAESLGAWVGLELPQASRFDISIDLTAEGWQQYQRVISALFSELELMRAEGLNADLYAEQKQLAQTDFLFHQSAEPQHEVTRLSQMMLRYPADQLLYAPYRYDGFEPELIASLLDRMRPQNMIISRYGDQLTGDRREPYYDIEYRITRPDSKLLAELSNPSQLDELSIRDLNPYVASSYQLLSQGEGDAQPTKILDTEDLRVWYLQDSQFDQPRAGINLAILSPLASQDAASSVKSALLTSILNEQQNETLYDAALAGLDLEFYSHMRGLSIKVSGYSERLDRLYQQALTGLSAPLDDPALFARIRQSYQESLENSLKDKPYNQAFSRLYSELMPAAFSAEEKLHLIEQLSLEDLRNWRTQLLEKIELRLLIHGNISRIGADQIAANTRSAFAPFSTATEVPPLTVRQLPAEQATEARINVAHSDAALLLYLQADNDSYQARAETALLNELLSSDFYSSLRTDQQLGYVVFSSYLPLAEQPGIALVAQSPVADAKQLQTAFTAFLEQWRRDLEARLDAQLDEYRESVRARLMTPSTRLDQETARLWREIDRDNPQFDTREQILAALLRINREDLLKRLDQLLQRQLWIATDQS